MQSLEPEHPGKVLPSAEQALREEQYLPGRPGPKHEEWERQVHLLEKSDEATRRDTFLQILLERLDLPAADMEPEEFP